MKKVSIIIFCLVCQIQITLAQKVDSIKVEQSGDFIKIKYQLPDSRPGQVFRVQVLCSINGGLNTEIESVSGDTGDHVAGGKPEYWVVWDVLKDVDNLSSAEFIVRAELISDMRSVSPGGKKENTSEWEKKWFNVMVSALGPGPKIGLRFGVMGSFGITGQIVQGKTVFNDDRSISYGSIVNEYSPTNQISAGIALTKRIVNINGFQAHILLGIQRTRITFRDPNANQTPYHEQKVFGPELGLAFGVKRLAFSLSAIHFDPGQVEKDSNWELASPGNYLSASIGVRF